MVYDPKGPYIDVFDKKNPPPDAKLVTAKYFNDVEAELVHLGESKASNEYVGTLAFGQTNLEATDSSVAAWVQDPTMLTGQAVAAAVAPKLGKTEAESTYLKQADAATTYLPQTTAGSTYLAKTATDAKVGALVGDIETTTGANLAALIQSAVNPKLDKTTATSTYSKLDTSLPDPRQYGTFDTAGAADSGPAIRAALAAGGASLPAGTIRIDGNLTLDADNMALHGLGDETHLDFHDGGLVIRAVDGGGYTFRNALRAVRITRSGAPGPALMLDGAGQGNGVARWAFHDVHVESSTGGGLLTRGAYIGSFHGCYFRNCAGWGIDCGTDEFGIGSNLLSFFGGEAQGNQQGVRVDVGASINFYGFGIEGNAAAGLEVISNARAVGLYGVYFEGNGGFDVKYGDAVTTTPVNFGLVMKGCQVSNGSSGKTKSVHLVQGRGVAIEDNFFAGYGTNSPVVVDEHAGGAVRGYARNNTTNATGTPIVNVVAGTRWGGLTMGAEGSQRTMWTGEAWQPLDFPSLPAGASAELPIPLPGVTTIGQVTNVVVTPHQGLESGLVAQALPGTDEVIVRLTNTSGATIEPLQRGFRAWAWIGAAPA